MENANSIGYAPVFGAGILVDAARGMLAVNFLMWLLTLGDREDLHEGLQTRIARLETRDAAAERAWQSLSGRVEALEAKVPRAPTPVAEAPTHYTWLCNACFSGLFPSGAEESTIGAGWVRCCLCSSFLPRRLAHHVRKSSICKTLRPE